VSPRVKRSTLVEIVSPSETVERQPSTMVTICDSTQPRAVNRFRGTYV
jgi:hypothetical protein